MGSLGRSLPQTARREDGDPDQRLYLVVCQEDKESISVAVFQQNDSLFLMPFSKNIPLKCSSSFAAVYWTKHVSRRPTGTTIRDGPASIRILLTYVSFAPLHLSKVGQDKR